MATNSNRIKFDCSQVPPADMKNLCRALVADMKRFYEDPKNLEGFERWQREQKKKEEAKNNACDCS